MRKENTYVCVSATHGAITKRVHLGGLGGSDQSLDEEIHLQGYFKRRGILGGTLPFPLHCLKHLQLVIIL